MNRLFFLLTFPKRSHLLWLAWLRALQPLRPACSRTRTFLWLVLVLAALCLRPDLAGVTSLVRSLGLSDASYYCLLHFFHSPALNLERLTQLWRQTLQQLFRRCLVRVNGRPVVLVDGLKRPKEGRKMPAVKSLHQESRCNAKASFIMGHSLQARRPAGAGRWRLLYRWTYPPEGQPCGFGFIMNQRLSLQLRPSETAPVQTARWSRRLLPGPSVRAPQRSPRQSHDFGSASSDQPVAITSSKGSLQDGCASSSWKHIDATALVPIYFSLS